MKRKLQFVNKLQKRHFFNKDLHHVEVYFTPQFMCGGQTVLKVDSKLSSKNLFPCVVTVMSLSEDERVLNIERYFQYTP